MLVLTEAAAEAVKSVTSTPQTPDGTGLRIVSSASEPEDPGALQAAARLVRVRTTRSSRQPEHAFL